MVAKEHCILHVRTLVNSLIQSQDFVPLNIYWCRNSNGPFTYFNAEASYVNLDGKQKVGDGNETNSLCDLRLSAGFHYYF